MNRKEKKAVVEELTELFQSTEFTFFVNPIGQTVEQSNTLRGNLFAKKARMQVVKNSLTWIALREAGREAWIDQVEGPTAVTVGESPVEVAKVLVDFAKEKANEGKLEIRGGWLNDKRLDYNSVVELAKCPPLPEMRAKTLSVLLAPAGQLVGLLNSAYAGFARVLQARADSQQ